MPGYGILTRTDDDQTQWERRQPDQTQLKLLQMAGDVHPNSGPATNYPVPYVLATSQVEE